MKNRTRTKELKIFLSEKEHYILHCKWKQSHMQSISSFIRHLILYGYVYEIDYSYLHECNTILARINNSLNQIAKRINTTGNFYEEDIKEIKELMETIWHTQKSMLSQQPFRRQ